MRKHGHDLKHEHAKKPERDQTLLLADGQCPFLTNGTCHAGQETKPTYACGEGCGMCAPLADQCLHRPCGSWTLKLRGTGGKFLREAVLLSLLERAAVGQSEGETLGHAPTLARLNMAKQLGSARILIIRDPIERIMSRYWFEGRWSLFQTPSEATAVSLEDWLLKARSRAKGTRVWNSVENYYVKTLAGCGGPSAACKTEGSGSVGEAELETAKRVLENDFTLVMLTEWLGSEGQRRLMASELCFAWPRPVLKNRQGEPRPVPELTPKRAAGGHTSLRPQPGWDVPSNHQTYKALLKQNAYDLQLFAFAADLVRRRVAGAHGDDLAAALPPLNVTARLAAAKKFLPS